MTACEMLPYKMGLFSMNPWHPPEKLLSTTYATTDSNSSAFWQSCQARCLGSDACANVYMDTVNVSAGDAAATEKYRCVMTKGLSMDMDDCAPPFPCREPACFGAGKNEECWPPDALFLWPTDIGVSSPPALPQLLLPPPAMPPLLTGDAVPTLEIAVATAALLLVVASVMAYSLRKLKRHNEQLQRSRERSDYDLQLLSHAATTSSHAHVQHLTHAAQAVAAEGGAATGDQGSPCLADLAGVTASGRPDSTPFGFMRVLRPTGSSEASSEAHGARSAASEATQSTIGSLPDAWPRAAPVEADGRSRPACYPLAEGALGAHRQQAGRKGRRPFPLHF